MRKITTLVFWKSLILTVALLAFIGVRAQNAPNDVFAFHYTIENDVFTSPNILEFDLYLLDTDPTEPFEMATVQAGIYVNSAIYNGGNITASILPGTSQLNTSQQPTNVTFTQSANVVKLATKAPPGNGNGTVISTTAPGTRICRIRLTNTVAFTSCSNANLTFCFTTSPYPTKVSIYTGGLNTACTMTTSNTFSNASNVVLNCGAPAPFNVTGGGSYCQGGAGLPVGLDNSESGTTYTLYKDGVAQLTTIDGTGAAITFGNQLAGTYTVTGTGTGGTVTMNGNAVITENPVLPVSVSIAANANTICAGTSVLFTATPVNGGTSPGYQWFINGLPVGTNTNTYSCSPANNDITTLVMTSDLTCATGNPATSNTITMTVNPLPVPTITGPSVVCEGGAGNVYTTETGMTGYTWTVSVGGTITAGGTTSDNNVTVIWNTTGAKTVSVNYTNSSSCPAALATVYNVNVNAFPVPTISGPTSAAAGTAQVYTTDAGMSGYNWMVSAGGMITSGGTTVDNTVTVVWNVAGSQSVSVNYNNAGNCQAAAPTVYPVSVVSFPPAAGSITGTTAVCQGATGVAYSVAAIPSATGYVWTLPAGASIASGANTNSITVDYSYSAVSGVITVCGTNTYGNGSPSPAYNVTVYGSPVPTITGSNTVCENSDYYTYTTEPGMTEYVWNISPNSGTITVLNGSNQAMIYWTSAGARWVSVSYTSPAGCTAAAPTQFDVTVEPLPGAAGTITGTETVCAGTAGVTYSVASVANAISYVWTIPAGSTIASGANSNVITVDFGSNASSGDITVIVENACGYGTSSPAYPVTISQAAAAAGPISGPETVCQETSGVIYSIAAIANADGYEWTVPAGAIIIGGDNTSTITVDFTNAASSGQVTVVGTNTCGTGPISALTVAVNPVPPAPVITQNDNILTSSAQVGNQWYFNGTQIPGATGQTYEAVYIGTYSAMVTINGCNSNASNTIS